MKKKKIWNHKIGLWNNEEGSTLMLVVIVLLIMSIAVVAFQTAIASFTTRVLTKHYEDQAYLSARSAAETIVNKIEEDCHNLSEGSSAELSVLLQNLYHLPEGESIELGEVTFQGLSEAGVDLDTGMVEASIHRIDTTTYVVEAVADVNGERDSVEIALEGAEISTSTSTGGYIAGNWNGFYTDLLVGATSPYTLNDRYSNLVTGLSTEYNFENNMYMGNVFANEDIVLENVTLQSGSIQTEGNLTIRENVTIASNRITAAGSITIMSNRELGVTSYSTEVVIESDHALLTGGPYVAETIIINGDYVTIYGPLVCETLIINGNYATITNVTADTIQVNGENATYNQAVAATSFAESEYGKTIAQLEEFSVVHRTKPEWAEYDTYKDITNVYRGEPKTAWPYVERFSGGYYTIDTSSGNFETYTTIEGNGTSEVEWTKITFDYDNISRSWGDIVYIVVKNNQNLDVTLINRDVYFILEGNAKVKFNENSEETLQTRIYGDAINPSVYDEILSESEGITDVAELMTIIESKWNRMSAVIIEGDDRMLWGNAIVSYIKVTGTDMQFNQVNDTGAMDNEDASDSSNLSGTTGGTSSSSYMTFQFGSYVN